LPLVLDQMKLPHITAVVTVMANGAKLPTLYILPAIKTLKSLARFEGQAYFASTASGWMNKAIFLAYAFILITELHMLQQRLPREQRVTRFLMTCDGHGSRFCFRACWLLARFGCELLVFLGHTSHFSQPIDRGIAGPAKTYLKKEFTRNFPKLAGLNPAARGKAAALRDLAVESFGTAIAQGASPGNVRAAFRKPGVAP
jgi:hypothetical protein